MSKETSKKISLNLVFLIVSAVDLPLLAAARYRALLLTLFIFNPSIDK